MSQERRRYFRIDETIGISYHILDGDDGSEPQTPIPDVLEMVSKQDQQIEKLLIDIAEDHPKVAELVTVFNQKLERIVHHLMLESHLVGKIAHKVKEANISACGIAFSNNESITEGALLKMELTLFPSEKHLILNGRVVSCDQVKRGKWYWRIDFVGVSIQNQEALIQHIVQCQSLQLKKMRGN